MSNSPTQVVSVELSFGSIEVHLTEHERFLARFAIEGKPPAIYFEERALAKSRWEALDKLRRQLSAARDALLAFHGRSEAHDNLRNAVDAVWDLLQKLPFFEERDEDGDLVTPEILRHAA